jgi:predicted dehydrogenase
VAYGYNNGLKIRIFGTKGSIEWEQEDPCKLKVSMIGKPSQILIQGRDYLADSARKYCRLPTGHPEGFYEAFANIYSAFTEVLINKKAGLEIASEKRDFAGVNEGLNGVRFIDACIGSSQENSQWVKY